MTPKNTLGPMKTLWSFPKPLRTPKKPLKPPESPLMAANDPIFFFFFKFIISFTEKKEF